MKEHEVIAALARLRSRPLHHVLGHDPRRGTCDAVTTARRLASDLPRRTARSWP